jgi:membrane associated rhomboid family serine protease
MSQWHANADELPVFYAFPALVLTLTAMTMARNLRHLIWLRELFPFTFVLLLWLIHLYQGFMQVDFSEYSLYPRTAHGLIGIITGALLHADFEHLLGNTIPLLILGFLLWSNYREIAGKVFWLVFFADGILLWCFGRESYHLGASGVVYGLAFFLFLSGFIRKIPRLTMISFLLIFLYGSMVWGVFPFDPRVSWESHLYGALAGIMLAFVLRKQGPQPPDYWKDEEELESLDSGLTEEEKALLTPEQLAMLSEKNLPAAEAKPEEPKIIRIQYDYKPKDDEKQP